MGAIDVTKNHNFPLPEARARAQKIIGQLTQASWCQNAVSAWNGDTLTFEIKGGVAKGVKGNLKVLPGSMTLHLDLPMLIATVWGKTITGEIDNYFRGAGLQ